MSRPYSLISITPRQTGRAVVECANCHIRQGVELSEDGEPEFESVPCSEDGCTERLCEMCPRFRCEGCDLFFCLNHAVVIEGERWWERRCSVCAAALRERESGGRIRR